MALIVSIAIRYRWTTFVLHCIYDSLGGDGFKYVREQVNDAGTMHWTIHVVKLAGGGRWGGLG